MRTFEQGTLCVLLASLLVGNGLPLASAQTRSRPAVTSGTVKNSGTLTTATPTSTYYECKEGGCSCTNPRDCGVMGGDHVCVPGTFEANDKGGGDCSEKKEQ
jgi:hypothetical protein